MLISRILELVLKTTPWLIYVWTILQRLMLTLLHPRRLPLKGQGLLSHIHNIFIQRSHWYLNIYTNIQATLDKPWRLTYSNADDEKDGQLHQNTSWFRFAPVLSKFLKRPSDHLEQQKICKHQIQYEKLEKAEYRYAIMALHHENSGAWGVTIFFFVTLTD